MRILDEHQNIKACIFDLDGTLLDSMDLWQDVDRRYLASYDIEFNQSFSEEIKSMTFNESAKYFIEKFNIPKSEDEIKEDWNRMVEVEYRDNIKCKSGSYELLEALKRNDIKMCIATSCKREHALMALKRLNIYSYFDFVMTCNDVGKNKEFPDIFIQCAKRMNVKQNECFVLEDLCIALKVSSQAGFKTIGIFDSLSAHEKENAEAICDYYIHDFRELI